MKEFIEKLIGRLEEEKQRLRNLKNNCIALSDHEVIAIEEGAYNSCKNIANELAEKYINCSTDTSTDTSTTNADRIRSMSDEELAEFLGGIDHTIDDCEFIVKIGDEWLHDSTADILDWLQSEVKGVTENE